MATAEAFETEVTNGRIVTLNCHIRGIVPCIISNGQMADPTNYWAQLVAGIRAEKGRKSFTQEQLERYNKALFVGQLYLKDHKKLAIPYWPAENIEAMIRSGAKKSRDGNAALLGVTVVDDAPLIYDGPKTADGMWDEGERFVFSSRVASTQKGKGTTVNVRCRFQQWELKFDAMLDTRLADVGMFRGWLDNAGWQVGLSAWHPKYGRFEVVSVRE